MIGIHIYPNTVSYTSKHTNITKELGDIKITLSYHKRYDKQVFFESDEYLVFLDGWIFNSPSYNKQAEFILKKYIKDSVNFIYKINGQFNLVIYNKVEHEYVYYNDIFSLRKHYYFLEKNKLFFSSDLTFITKHIKEKTLNSDHITKNINLPRFIDIKETFIKGIKQGFPCMKMTKHSISKYSIEKVKDNFSSNENDPVYFLEKLKKRISKLYRNENILLLLSGGLDSRFLLEMFNDMNFNIQTATHGNDISDEVQIAKKVAELNNVKHFICNLSAKDFLKNAQRYIDETYGLDIFVQSYVYEFYSFLENKIKKDSIIDTGFALDVFLGGSYINDIKKFQNDINIAQIKISNLDEYSTENRVFSALAIRQSAHREFYEDRYSMYDYEIYFLMKNLPVNLIKDNKFYYCLCQLQIKNSFNIPLQSTMFDLKLAPQEWKNAEAVQLNKEKFVLDYFKNFKKPLYHNRYYSDFGMWIRDKNEWKNFVEDIFINNESILSKLFLKQNTIENTIKEHMSGKKNHIRNIIKWISLELFFKSKKINLT